MPIYEYRCDACGEQMEKLQRMSDDRLVDCPACGKPALKRLVSAVAFRLKGSGWYETDFKKDNKRNLSDSGSGNASSGSSGSGSTDNSSGASSSSGDSSKESGASSDSKRSSSGASSDSGSKKTDTKSITKPSAKPSTKAGSD